MHKFAIGVGLLSLFACSAGSVEADTTIIEDFVAFDRAFIPPLVLTKQAKVAPAATAMELLTQSWAAFKGKHYESNVADVEWKADLDRIEKHILDAASMVQNVEGLMPAHEELEQVRTIALRLRQRNDMGYYLDLVIEFHDAMEVIYHAGKDISPESPDEEAIQSLSATVSKATALWQQVREAPFDKDLYGFTEQMAQKMQEYHAAEQRALERVAAAIGSGDKAAIKKTAKGVKANYAMLYKMFGDFERVKGKSRLHSPG